MGRKRKGRVLILGVPHYPSQDACLQAVETGLLLFPRYPSQGACLQAIETVLLLSPP